MGEADCHLPHRTASVAGCCRILGTQRHKDTRHNVFSHIRHMIPIKSAIVVIIAK